MTTRSPKGKPMTNEPTVSGEAQRSGSASQQDFEKWAKLEPWFNNNKCADGYVETHSNVAYHSWKAAIGAGLPVTVGYDGSGLASGVKVYLSGDLLWETKDKCDSKVDLFAPTPSEYE